MVTDLGRDLVLVESLRMTSILQSFPFLDPSRGEAILTAQRHLVKFWSLKEHNVLFGCLLSTFLAMIVEEILHLQGSFQGALGLDDSVRYRCNCPHLYLTEGHSIHWKFFLANQKLFHLIWSALRISQFGPTEDATTIQINFFRSIVTFTFTIHSKIKEI